MQVTNKRAAAVHPVAMLWWALFGGLIGIWIPLAGVADGWIGACWTCDPAWLPEAAAWLPDALLLPAAAGGWELAEGCVAAEEWPTGAAAWATTTETMAMMMAIKIRQCRIEGISRSADGEETESKKWQEFFLIIRYEQRHTCLFW